MLKSQDGLQLRGKVASIVGWTVSASDGRYVICKDGKPAYYGTWGMNAQPTLMAFQVVGSLPHYEADLNAMHEIERSLDDSRKKKYLSKLAKLSGSTQTAFIATAEQRAKAFAEVFGKIQKERAKERHEAN